MTSSPASKRTECVVPREISLHKCAGARKNKAGSTTTVWSLPDTNTICGRTQSTHYKLNSSSSWVAVMLDIFSETRKAAYVQTHLSSFLQHTLATALRCVISASKIITYKPVFFVSPCARADCLVFWHWTHEAIMIPFRIWVGKNPIPSRNVDSWFSYWLL